MAHPDLQIHITAGSLQVIQQTTRGIFTKQFPPLWEGVDALLKWFCDMVLNGSQIQIHVDNSQHRAVARHLVLKLQDLECRTGDKRSFKIIP